MESLVSKTRMVRGREEVYVAAMPLRASKGPPQLLMSAAYSLNIWDLQHFMVIIKPSSPSKVSILFLPHILLLFFFYREKKFSRVESEGYSGRSRPRDVENVLYFIANIYFQVLVFDFQPKDPEDIYVALAVLSGRAVPGQIWTLFITCELSDWIFSTFFI